MTLQRCVKHFITRHLLTRDYFNIDACISMLCQRSRGLDDLQHSLIRMQLFMRLMALITVPELCQLSMEWRSTSVLISTN